MSWLDFEVHPKAHALRPIRVDEKANNFINYEATTFPKDPRSGCEMWLRRASICGRIIEGGEGPLGIDVLNRDGDILQTLTITRASFEYLRRSLKFKKEPTE